MTTNFSKYFDDQINDCNWEVAVDKDGFFSVLDGDGCAIASDIDHAKDAFLMANAQRFFNMLDKKKQNIILALIEQQKKEAAK